MTIGGVCLCCCRSIDHAAAAPMMDAVDLSVQQSASCGARLPLPCWASIHLSKWNPPLWIFPSAIDNGGKKTLKSKMMLCILRWVVVIDGIAMEAIHVMEKRLWETTPADGLPQRMLGLCDRAWLIDRKACCVTEQSVVCCSSTEQSDVCCSNMHCQLVSEQVQLSACCSFVVVVIGAHFSSQLIVWLLASNS